MSSLPESFSVEPNFQSEELVLSAIELWQSDATHINILTSGSTGKPKTIALSKKLIQWSIHQTSSSLQLTNEKVLCCLPVNKTGGVMQIFRALVLEQAIHFVEPSSNPLVQMEGHDFTFASFTPYQLTSILKSNEKELSRFKKVLIGGSTVNEDLQQAINAFCQKYPFPEIYETYGMTETASHIGLKNIRNKDSMFTPQPGVEIVITADQRIEITIPDANVHLISNDLGVLKDNKLLVLGRTDNVINSGGVKIIPEEIEPKIKGILSALRINRNLYLFGKEDSALGEKVVLVLEGIPITDTRFILEILNRELPPYAGPKEIIFKNEFATTSTGKLIREKIGKQS